MLFRISTSLRWLVMCLFALAFLSSAIADEPVPLARTLVDFEKEEDITLRTSQAKAVFAQSKDGQALEITTESGADYPSVKIEAKSGPWDLRGFEAVTGRFYNPQDVPLRVLISVNNANANGREHASAASLTIGPGERGTLTVPLGLWHGQPSTLDVGKVASLEILLDRPGRGHRFQVEKLLATRRERFDLEKAMANPFFQQLAPPLGRGINLGNALEAPREGEWGVTLEESYFTAIAEAGFDSIRLPVRWSAHADHAAPYTIDPKFLARVDWAVEQTLSRKLSVVLNVHHYAEMDDRPDEHRARLVELWRQIAEHYRDRPAALVFELLNEPHNKLTAPKWNAILRDALAVVRASNPTRPVVIGPVAWNSIGELPSLELPADDRNLIVTVHYYSPFSFTHQGAHWLDAKSRPPVGVKWTGTEAEREAVLRDLDAAALWGLAQRRPIFVGEFGAFDKADLESRVRWTKFVADECLRRRMGYAYWEFCSGFGAYDPLKHAWIEPLKNAIVPPRK